MSWFARDSSTGALTYLGLLRDGENGVDGLRGANSLTLSADGNHAYVTGQYDDAVSWYERNASTGALTYEGMLKDGVGGVDGLNGANCVVISGNGKHAFVTGYEDDAVSWYERNASTGVLTYGGRLRDGVGGVDGLNGAQSVSLSSDGNHAYVTGSNDDSLSWFDLDAISGALSFGEALKSGRVPDGSFAVDGLSDSRSLTLSDDGKHIYATSYTDDTVNWFERNSTNGEFTFSGLARDDANGVSGLREHEI